MTQETYRKLVRHSRYNNVFSHTYQLKGERAYRIVIKYLHHSTHTEDIKQELFEIRHNVRNIINTQHRTTNEPLNLFLVDLEPAEDKKEIYNIKVLQNKIVKTETHRVNKNNIVQNMRCQQYGRHTKSHRNKPFMCVKCGGSRNSEDREKVKKHQRNAHYVEAIILPTTKAANIIIT